MPVVVQPLDAVAGGRLWPHVLQEDRKAAAPGVADGDAAAAIALEVGIFTEVTAAAHGAPDPELRRVLASCGSPVKPASLAIASRSLALPAAAASRAAGLEFSQ